MKKINNIVQLQMEQEKLAIKQAHIESALIHKWAGFKKELTIRNLAKETMYSLISPKNSHPKDLRSVVKGGLYIGATLLLRQWMKNKN